MEFGAVIVGDEVLSARRADKHLTKLIEMLGARGLRPAWARYAGDDEAHLFSLPRIEGPGDRRSIKLGVKGCSVGVACAMDRIRGEVSLRGYEWQDKV